MSGSRASYLAARREVRERLRSRAFRISTLIQVLAVIVIAIIASVAGGGATEVEIGYVGGQGKEVVDRAEAAQEALDVEIEARSYATITEARSAVADGDVEAVAGGSVNFLASDASDEVGALLRQAQGQIEIQSELKRAGVSDHEAERLLTAGQESFRTVEVNGGDGGGGIAFITTLLLYLALIFCGYAVSSGVTEEKSTRVVELIINAIKPRQLLAGKVAGIGLLGLGQLLLIILVGLGSALVLGEIDLPDATLDTAILALVYFILGYVLYGCAFAMAGSLVSRQEDAQSSTAPVMMVLVAGYILSISVTSDAGSSLAQICTYIPPIAPMIVPARAAAGELPVEQLAISLVLMVAFCAGLIWLAGRVYERAVLRMGAPVRFRELAGMLRSR